MGEIVLYKMSRFNGVREFYIMNRFYRMRRSHILWMRYSLIKNKSFNGVSRFYRIKRVLYTMGEIVLFNKGVRRFHKMSCLIE